MNVLLLDEDEELTRLLEGVLEADGMWVVPYSDPADAVAGAINGKWVAALVNLDLEDGAAEAFLEVLGDLDDVDLPIILTSARHKEFSEEVQRVMKQFGTRLFLRKPIPLLDLNDLLRRARETGGDIEALPSLDSCTSISLDLGLSDVNEVAFSPDGETETPTAIEVEDGSHRRRALRGALTGRARVRRGISELDETEPLDLAPISVAPEELQEIAPMTATFDLEIEDEDSDETSISPLHK